MYNLHCHSLLSDGCLLPSEVARRYAQRGYKVIAITDHVDYSNIKGTVSSILEFSRNWPASAKIKVLPGIELTHLPLEQFKPLVKFARAKGIKIIIGHGESPAEPVLSGTNRACLEAGVDILAHPGMISDVDVKFAKAKGIYLEITTRRGHKATNKYVARQARKFGAKLILNTDSHAPEDIVNPGLIRKTAKVAGLTPEEIGLIYKNTTQLLKMKGVR